MTQDTLMCADVCLLSNHLLLLQRIYNAPDVLWQCSAVWVAVQQTYAHTLVKQQAIVHSLLLWHLQDAHCPAC
jgi:hypothetical protein